MLQKLTALGKSYHEATKHSYLSVLIDPNYVDSITQPSAFKQYPHFYRRFPLEDDNPLHNFIRLTSQITFEKKYKHDAYFLRVNPSAGALYPTEIYLQVRGVKGIIDGIYHLEVSSNSLTLIYELIDDGLEYYLFDNCQVNGLIFLLSCAYFRSSWKYKNRSLRYCFLDAGHHLGAIEAAAFGQERKVQALLDFDKCNLNEDLGLENKEFITTCLISGELKQKNARRLRSLIPFVQATDYFEANTFIEAGYQQTITQSIRQNICQIAPSYPSLDLGRFTQSILARRSARSFKKGLIMGEELLQILECISRPLPLLEAERVSIYVVVNRVEGLQAGVYLEQRLLKAGDFSDHVGYLCINQAVVRDSAVAFLFTANYGNYQHALQIAGWLGQKIYLMSQYLNIGCSGIGAFYDDETQEFLETQEDILYAMVIGK
jgi:SagB-type dehydrogenase family enzyme